MSCSSAIYTVNSSPSDILGEAQIPFGNVVRRFGKNLGMAGNGIMACGDGYYNCMCSVTLEAAAEGIVTAQLYVNGQPYQGAFASESADAVGDSVNLAFPAIIRLRCCDGPATLEVRLGEEGATLTNMAFSAVKL